MITLCVINVQRDALIDSPSNEPVNAVSIEPMPGDAHDAAVQMAEWYASLQPETPSRIRLSD